jgi:hypothetical protein
MITKTFGAVRFGTKAAVPRSTGLPPAMYPAAVASNAQLTIAVDRLQTRLAAPLSPSSSSMTVTDDNSGIIPNCLLTIEDEIVQTQAGAGNQWSIIRGRDGTVPAIHLSGATVSGFVDAWHHNALVSEVQAIQQTLGPNLSNVTTTQIAVLSTDYKFGPLVSGNGVSVSGGNLVVGANALTFATVPKGVNGTDVDHYLWIAGGTGTPEAVKITGGSGSAGQANGQIIVNCAFAHSGAWTIESASNGLAEACSFVGGKGGGNIQVPAGTHEMRATVRVQSYTSIRGVGCYNTMLHRTANYGNTFVMGFSNGGVNNVVVEDVFFFQEIGFVTGAPPTVANKPTSGAHCQVNGGNTISFRRCRFQDLVIGINIVGCAQVMVDDCIFQGLWSPAYPSGQVTIADIQISNDATLGISTYIKIRGCALIGGYRGPANEVWGSRFRVLVNGVEDLEILGGAVAASAVNNIQLLPTASGSILGQVRITAGVRFDGAPGADINITGDGTGQCANISVIGCQFNGQKLGLTFPYSLNAIDVAPSPNALSPVVLLNIADNIIFNYQNSAIRLDDGAQFQITGNSVCMYNLGANIDSANATGIFIGSKADYGLIEGNLIGGDNTGKAAYGTGNNKCLFGVFLTDPLVAQAHVTLSDNYPPFPAAIGTANDQMFASYTNQAYFISIETGANNAIAAALPNVPLLRGVQVAVLLAHTLQAGANTFNLNATGAKAIKSGRNPSTNIAVGYLANAVIALLYDGVEWLDLSQ